MKGLTAIEQPASSEGKLVFTGDWSAQVLEKPAELDATAPSAEIADCSESTSIEPQVIMLPAPAASQRSNLTSYQFPSIELLAQPPQREGEVVTEDILEKRAGRVEKVIRDFGVKGGGCSRSSGTGGHPVRA